MVVGPLALFAEVAVEGQVAVVSKASVSDKVVCLPTSLRPVGLEESLKTVLPTKRSGEGPFGFSALRQLSVKVSFLPSAYSK